MKKLLSCLMISYFVFSSFLGAETVIVGREDLASDAALVSEGEFESKSSMNRLVRRSSHDAHRSSELESVSAIISKDIFEGLIETDFLIVWEGLVASGAFEEFNNGTQARFTASSALIRSLEDLGYASYGVSDFQDYIQLRQYSRKVFDYFWENGDSEHHYLVPEYVDSVTGEKALNVSVAGSGFALAAYLLGVDQGWVSLDEALGRVEATLSFYQGAARENSLFYHFYNIETGLPREDVREGVVGTVESSTIDTALFLAGVLFVKEYLLLHQDVISEEVRASLIEVADALYDSVDWTLVEVNGVIGHGFIRGVALSAQWDTYAESSLLYLLAIGAPTHAVSSDLWSNIVRAPVSHLVNELGEEQTIVGAELPLFVHQFSHAWVDLRDLQQSESETLTPMIDAEGMQYFENSRYATLANRQYCLDLGETLPSSHVAYGEFYWGLSAGLLSSDNFQALGPAFEPFPNQEQTGRARVFPSAMMASLVFAPTDVHEMFDRLLGEDYVFADSQTLLTEYGFANSFTFNDIPDGVNEDPIVTYHIDIDKGAELLMLDNYLTGSVWNTLSRNQNIQYALASVGFPVFPGEASGAQSVQSVREVVAPSIACSIDESIIDDVEDFSIVAGAVAGQHGHELQRSVFEDFSDQTAMDIVAIQDFQEAIVPSSSTVFEHQNPLVGLDAVEKRDADKTYYYRVRAWRPYGNLDESGAHQGTFGPWSETLVLTIPLSDQTLAEIESARIIAEEAEAARLEAERIAAEEAEAARLEAERVAAEEAEAARLEAERVAAEEAEAARLEAERIAAENSTIFLAVAFAQEVVAELLKRSREAFEEVDRQVEADQDQQVSPKEHHDTYTIGDFGRDLYNNTLGQIF